MSDQLPLQLQIIRKKFVVPTFDSTYGPNAECPRTGSKAIIFKGIQLKLKRQLNISQKMDVNFLTKIQMHIIATKLSGYHPFFRDN